LPKRRRKTLSKKLKRLNRKSLKLKGSRQIKNHWSHQNSLLRIRSQRLKRKRKNGNKKRTKRINLLLLIKKSLPQNQSLR